MADWVLTVYGDDDATPLFAVGTAAGHAHPYLHLPDEFGSSEIDLLKGTAVIGQISARVIDPQTGATKQDRYLSGLLASTTGHSQLIRRRAVITQTTPSATPMDGVIGAVRLNDSFAGFTLDIRDIRERGRKVPAFSHSDTATVLPRGVLRGYGLVAGTSYVVPATVPLLSTFTAGGFLLDGAPTRAGGRITDPRLIVTAAVREALHTVPVVSFGFTPTLRYDRISVMWRLVGTGGVFADTATEVVRPQPGMSPFTLYGSTTRALLATLPAVIALPDGTDREVDAARMVNILDSGATNGQRYEIVIRYLGPVSEQYPWHYEGTWGTLVKNLLDGDYSIGETQGYLGTVWNNIDPRMRYDSAAILAIDKPVRVRMAKPREDIRKALEELCAQIGAAPALNAAGEISPILSVMPAADATLPQIDDSNAVAIAGWEHPSENAVTVVRVKYARDYATPAVADPMGEESKGDAIRSHEIEVHYKAPQAALDIMGEQDIHEIDAWAFRAIGTAEGSPVSGDIANEDGARLAEQTARSELDRFAYGGPSSFCRLAAADFTTLRVGDWVTDARSWRPDYGTNKRGGNALAQVMSLKLPDPAWLEVRLVDAGPGAQGPAVPTFGALSQSDGVVTVPVATLPSGADCEVQYALGSAPSANSHLWLYLGRRTGTGDIESAPQPAGVTFNARGRSVIIGRRPSAWVSCGNIVIASTPALRSLELTPQADGSMVATWTQNAYAAGVRLAWEAHDVATVPTLADTVDVAASAGTYTFPAVDTGLALFTVSATPYPTFGGGACSGTPGAALQRTARVIVTDQGTAFPYVDIDGDELWLFPNLNTGVTSFRYRVDTDDSTYGEVDTTGTLSVAEKVLVHTFTAPAERVVVGFVAYAEVDGTGADTGVINMPATYAGTSGTGPLPEVFGYPVNSAVTGNEAYQLVATSPTATVALYHRTYTKGGSPPAYTRQPTSGFGADPQLYRYDVAKPAEGAQPVVIEAYAEDAGGVSQNVLYVEVDGNAIPSGIFTIQADPATGAVKVIASSTDSDTGSWRFRCAVGDAGAAAYDDPDFADGHPEYAGAGPPDVQAISGTNFPLAAGKEVLVSGYFFRTVSAVAATQSASARSPNARAAYTHNPSVIPTFRAEPSQSGDSGVMTLTVYDPWKRVTALEYKTKVGAAAWAAAWSAMTVVSGTAGTDVTLVRTGTVALAGSHNSELAWQVTYTAAPSVTAYLGGSHTYDVDIEPEILSCMISFTSAGVVEVSVVGDEDVTAIFGTAGTAPSDPNSTTYHFTIAARSGSVSTGQSVAYDTVAVVKLIGYRTGPNQSITGAASTDILTCVAHGLATNSVVRLSGITGLAGLSAGVSYYVINAAADTFKLSATQGGGAINITSDGSATLNLYTAGPVMAFNARRGVAPPSEVVVVSLCTISGTLSGTNPSLSYAVAVTKPAAYTVDVDLVSVDNDEVETTTNKVSASTSSSFSGTHVDTNYEYDKPTNTGWVDYYYRATVKNGGTTVAVGYSQTRHYEYILAVA